jgi:FkbM family methyltransferase
MSKKVFIDCGGLNGCSVRYFLDNFENSNEYEIYTFEPNLDFDETYDEIKNKLGEKFTRYKKAVSNYNGNITFFKNENNPASNTTNPIKGNKPGCGSDIKGNVSQYVVECIDLDEWIRSNFSPTDYIILKLDVEGSEYDIVPKMIKNKTFLMIDELHLEWHPYWCEVPTIYGQFLSEMISKAYNVKVNDKWNTMGY